MMFEKIKYYLIEKICEAKNREKLVKVLKDSMCFVNMNIEEGDEA